MANFASVGVEMISLGGPLGGSVARQHAPMRPCADWRALARWQATRTQLLVWHKLRIICMTIPPHDPAGQYFLCIMAMPKKYHWTRNKVLVPAGCWPNNADSRSKGSIEENRMQASPTGGEGVPGSGTSAGQTVTEARAMNKTTAITCLFLDIGGVLLTNGWDHHARERAASAFALDLAEMESRHNLTFDTYEQGKLTLEEYLGRIVFHQKRPFTRARFRNFIFAQSKPYPDMIELIRQIKARDGLKIAVVSNEGRELNSHRIRKFKLDEFVDFFISSSFVHLRKPDADIFRMALDVAQVPASQVAYIEDRPMFVEVAKTLGICGVLHTDYESTRAKLAALGLGSGHPAG